MPIIIKGTQSLLVCVNREHPSHTAVDQESTMGSDVSWYVLQSANAPPLPHGNAIVTFGGPVLGVRPYVCHVCGYVELYAAKVIDPGTWGGVSR